MTLRKSDCLTLFIPNLSDHRTIVVHHTYDHPAEVVLHFGKHHVIGVTVACIVGIYLTSKMETT